MVVVVVVCLREKDRKHPEKEYKNL